MIDFITGLRRPFSFLSEMLSIIKENPFSLSSSWQASLKPARNDDHLLRGAINDPELQRMTVRIG
jgi:hypothetical protein